MFYYINFSTLKTNYLCISSSIHVLDNSELDKKSVSVNLFMGTRAYNKISTFLTKSLPMKYISATMLITAANMNA